jgi:hypothetical protein
LIIIASPQARGKFIENKFDGWRARRDENKHTPNKSTDARVRAATLFSRCVVTFSLRVAIPPHVISAVRAGNICSHSAIA